MILNAYQRDMMPSEDVGYRAEADERTASIQKELAELENVAPSGGADWETYRQRLQVKVRESRLMVEGCGIQLQIYTERHKAGLEPDNKVVRAKQWLAEARQIADNFRSPEEDEIDKEIAEAEATLADLQARKQLAPTTKEGFAKMREADDEFKATASLLELLWNRKALARVAGIELLIETQRAEAEVARAAWDSAFAEALGLMPKLEKVRLACKKAVDAGTGALNSVDRAKEELNRPSTNLALNWQNDVFSVADLRAFAARAADAFLKENPV